jgi:hypothetical protein
MDKRLIKAGRMEEFYKQFRDFVEREVFRKLRDKEKKACTEPMNCSTIMEAYKDGRFVTQPLQDIYEQQHEQTTSFRVKPQ